MTEAQFNDFMIVNTLIGSVLGFIAFAYAMLFSVDEYDDFIMIMLRSVAAGGVVLVLTMIWYVTIPAVLLIAILYAIRVKITKPDKFRGKIDI